MGMKNVQGFSLNKGKKWELLEAECTLKLESVLKISDVYMSSNKRKLMTGKKKKKRPKEYS